ncbi:SPFH domain-containing protein [Streptomonospora nanhaiensis]|uniref:Regulator of protease activity HflC (Stomatin/prohibitin superfamily) n=1 Tax=Streptomonospora nanhaiensis TaxID=1323731 RepID=A0A853BR49_9ACTN|nr:SPFH domain-containing protein [Streptomonospora nanhaiensis]MBV2363864.1 SPFH/Band 7/PHB domain protein [Streptomonospora nanhaiensis]MBX9388232.1 SPFH/Band 7/PHB domain protein [Streptomonospora nanhaiensis]NYI96832.1 regulator of protease activity HflC (stomatin/prohibitin superfamily) [Streptomonospora nanhaiensis]
MGTVIVILLIFVAVLAVIGWFSVRIVPQAEADVVERFGGYHRTLSSGFHIVIPFVDHVRERIDLRVQVVSFPPQAAITQDNLSVNVDTAVYVRVTDPYNATYKVASFIQAVEQLASATLRNVIGGMDLEQTLTSRDQINRELRAVLDEATAEWGIEVSRVELKAIEPPESVQEAMEKQMRADRDKRAEILTAEGQKQSAILRAEGEQSAAVLSAQGAAEAEKVRAKAEAEAMTVRARGEADAIMMVARALNSGKVTNELLAYQYLQKLPEIARGDANKVWIVPSEMGKALESIGGMFDRVRDNGAEPHPAGEANGQGRPVEPGARA